MTRWSTAALVALPGLGLAAAGQVHRGSRRAGGRAVMPVVIAESGRYRSPTTGIDHIWRSWMDAPADGGAARSRG